ncbi:MAG: ribose 5-phosphate isomerase B [bacterium]|nr:MAG: ribose 5-phosphate isomerase B [bacterium]
MLDLSEKQVITEQDLKTLAEGAQIQLAESAIITPLARDLINSRQLQITRRLRRGKKRIIALSADHGGYEMKEALKVFLTELAVDYHDFGTNDTKAVDYPDYAFMVASGVSQGNFSLGIIIDGAGIGSCMVANKLPGVRAAMANSVALARNSREHNDANVLTLGGKMITLEAMREIVKVWLETSITEERHLSRVAKIVDIEKQYIKK